MPILKTEMVVRDGSIVRGETTEIFTGRVLAVEKCSEVRNLSDTLDYTDFQSVEAVYALVWLGTHAVPYHRSHDGRRGQREEYGVPARDLEPHEQFVWLDCSNLFTWRGSDLLVPTVDFSIADCTGEPLMWANYDAWQDHLERERLERAVQAATEKAQAEAEAAKEAAKKAARVAKRQAKKDEAAKSLANFTKGTKVAVGEKVGEVFWTGVTEYRGKVSGRIGVRVGNGREDVVWCDATEAQPV